MTSTITRGKRGYYFWCERSIESSAVDLPLVRLVEVCPEVVLKKRVVVTSLDSGPLRLSDAQIDAGWQRFGDLAISPPIRNGRDVPFQWFDEWYIFKGGLPVKLEVEVFVNYAAFSLGEPNIDAMYVGSDPDVRTRMVAAVELLRERFWEQLERLNPESYLANGNCFMFVTRDAKLHELVSTLVRSL